MDAGEGFAERAAAWTAAPATAPASAVSAVSAVSRTEPTSAPSDADRDVLDAAAALTGLAGLPLAERVAALEDVHRQLTAALDAPDGA